MAAIQPRGERPPFFCVNASALFRPLAYRLGFEQPFLGLPSPVEALQPPFTLEQVAACHVKTIREVQARGPYFIGGWSNGGAIAYEIAQQLQSQGEDIALLALFDAANPTHKTTPRQPMVRQAQLDGHKLTTHWGILRQGKLRQVPGYVAAKCAEFLRVYGWRGLSALHRWTGRRVDANLWYQAMLLHTAPIARIRTRDESLCSRRPTRIPSTRGTRSTAGGTSSWTAWRSTRCRAITGRSSMSRTWKSLARRYGPA